MRIVNSTFNCRLGRYMWKLAGAAKKWLKQHENCSINRRYRESETFDFVFFPRRDGVFLPVECIELHSRDEEKKEKIAANGNESEHNNMQKLHPRSEMARERNATTTAMCTQHDATQTHIRTMETGRRCMFSKPNNCTFYADWLMRKKFICSTG